MISIYCKNCKQKSVVWEPDYDYGKQPPNVPNWPHIRSTCVQDYCIHCPKDSLPKVIPESVVGRIGEFFRTHFTCRKRKEPKYLRIDA